MSKPPRKPGTRSGGGPKDPRGGRDRRGRGDERPQRGGRSERPAGPRSESKSGPRSERPLGQRGERKFGERPQGARSEGPRGDRASFGKPRFGGRDERAPHGARPERSERPYQGSRPERSAGPARSERPQRSEFPQRSERPQRDFAPRGDRPQRTERPQRSERPPSYSRPERSARPERSERQPERQAWSDRPQRPARAERGPRAEVSVQPWRGKQDFRSAGGPERGERSGERPAFRPRKVWRKPTRDPDGPVLLYGWHSVKAALENPARKFHKILATENALHRLRDDGVALPVEPELVDASVIDAELGPDAVHQGLLAEADPLPTPDISEVAPEGIILVLDQVTDPHNVGAILRTAVAFGVTAIVTTQRHSPEMTGVLAKAASGALEYVPMVFVPNLARALDALKKNNVFVVGLDSEGDGDIASVPLRAPLALVIGAEGKGLRQLTRATCDQVARLELPGKIKSLNVSNATALALYVAASRVASG